MNENFKTNLFQNTKTNITCKMFLSKEREEYV